MTGPRFLSAGLMMMSLRLRMKLMVLLANRWTGDRVDLNGKVVNLWLQESMNSLISAPTDW